MLQETAEYTGLAAGVTDPLLNTYVARRAHARGQVFCDVAARVLRVRTTLRLRDRSMRHVRLAWPKPLRPAQPARGDNSCAGHEVSR